MQSSILMTDGTHSTIDRSNGSQSLPQPPSTANLFSPQDTAHAHTSQCGALIGYFLSSRDDESSHVLTCNYANCFLPWSSKQFQFKIEAWLKGLLLSIFVFDEVTSIIMEEGIKSIFFLAKHMDGISLSTLWRVATQRVSPGTRLDPIAHPFGL